MWDLANDGASLLSARPISQGSSLELRVTLTGATAAIVAGARVVYSSYLGPGEFKIGLAFTKLDDDGAAAIAAFMA